MRICYVSTGKSWGGGEQLLASLIDAMTAAKQEVTLVARQGSPLASWWRERQPGHLLELPGHGRSPRSLWRLRRCLQQRDAEVAVLNDPHAISSGILAALGLDVLRLGVRHTVFPIRSAWKHDRMLDAVVCVSAAAEQEGLAVGIPREKIAVIHGGAPRPKLSTQNVRRVREMFDASGDRNILAIGSLLPVKGFDTLLRAVARGVAAGRQWRLWIAGDGPQRGSLSALAGNLGVADRVHFLGFRDDVGELLSEADLFVSASHSEGLSLVLIEAMLARCPIAATAVGGSREVLGTDEKGHTPLAETFTPGDAAELTAAIDRSLLSTPASQMRLELAERWAQEHFSIEQMAQKHLTLYRKLLAPETLHRRAVA